jgi:signal transduction histidine kinase
VTIGCHAGETGLVLSVADSGIGIAPEHIATVMEPFGQVDNHMARQHVGTGLGLPLSRELARMHGGDLVLESQINVGTTVTLTLPADRLVPEKGALTTTAA